VYYTFSKSPCFGISQSQCFHVLRTTQPQRFAQFWSSSTHCAPCEHVFDTMYHERLLVTVSTTVFRLTTVYLFCAQFLPYNLFTTRRILKTNVLQSLNCTMRSCMVCTLRPVLLEWSKQGGWDGRGIWRAWGWWGVHTTFWLGGLKEGDH
jgi:hypothetical protein